ncbi:MAG: 3',5'-cyclic-nucleotide phosphodiesterase [Acidobacteria bacterium]|nr:3',5'-cyclic-nucleotide phosphodiesterase [Acidobacteriota bacterium]
MKIQLLPSTIDPDGTASVRQHLSCLVIDDLVAIDAGSLAQSSNPQQKEQVRDVVLTHAHLDHIAGLPLFVDDLFATVRSPIVIHAVAEVIEVLENNIFNWSVYPRFSELRNDFGSVMEYRAFEIGVEFTVQHLSVRAIGVNHKVPSVGFILSDGDSVVAMTGDTAELNGFWDEINALPKVSAVIVESAFPNRLEGLARISHHLTPAKLGRELSKLKHDCPIYVMSIKPAYYDSVVEELGGLGIESLTLFKSGMTISSESLK